jgi:anaerobic magnesium-protoporphyrin IX monomethyl ester cyclase
MRPWKRVVDIRNARVLLVGPEQEENLSLRYLAAALQASGVSWRIARFDSSSDASSVLAEVARFRPLVVGMAMTFQSRSQEVIDLTHRIRQHHPTCHITAGGHFASIRAKELLTDFSSFDSIIRSEGEDSLCRLTHALLQNRQLEGIPNLVFRRADGTICENPARDVFPDLDTLSGPVRPARPDRHAGFKTAHLLGSRGCYHSSCRYCCIAAFHAGKKGP